MMERKSATLSLLWPNLKGGVLVDNRIPTIVAGLAVLVLAVVVVLLAFSATELGVSPGTVAGVEAASARWSALGEYYAESRARAADAARWSALGAQYAPDYEAIAAVSSARWSALAESYAEEVVQGR